MNRIIPILFVLGFIWAPFMLVPALGLFADDDWNEKHVISVAALAGFWVWYGWGWHCLTGRFPLVSARIFWSISLVVHLVWLGILWDLVLLNSIWTVPNVIVAFVGLLPESGGNGWKHKVASLAAYGLALAWAVLAVVAYSRDIHAHLGAANALPLVVVVFALLVTVWLSRFNRSRNDTEQG